MIGAAKRIVRRSAPGAGAGIDLPAGLHPVLARAYALRDLASARELDASMDHLLPFTLLGGIDAAAAVLEQALRSGWRILVVADFDADGATSCALALRALRAMGARRVGYLVPNRFDYGYGLSPEIVALACAGDRPDLIVTVDNGIASIAGVAAARECGIAVLITDHHLPGAELPRAAAIVDPNLPGDPFPSKHLAGVGVIFYVMLALRARLRESAWFEERGIAVPNLARLLDLVALGTIADLVRLDHNNRILVAQGLRRIRVRQCCPGIGALLAIAGRDQGRAVAADLGYAVGPRLNAAGRLEDMALGIECLLSDDASAALAMARRLDDLNRERRSIEAEMQEQALAHLARLQLEAVPERPALSLCLFDDSWHQGVIGILAARIRERTHRPVIAFAPAGGDEIKGSARSVAGLHVRDALEAVATRCPQLIVRFGGHAMAAGLTLRAHSYESFRAAFEDEVRRRLSEDDLEGIVYSDGELAPEELTLNVAELLREGGPWGQGFPEPLFDGRFAVVEQRLLGERHLKLRLQPAGSTQVVEAIAFNRGAGLAAAGAVHHVAYRLDVNEYRGRRSPQLIVEHIT